MPREKHMCVDYIIFRKLILMSQTVIKKIPVFHIISWSGYPILPVCQYLHHLYSSVLFLDCDIYWYLSNISNPILGNVFNVWCHVVLHVFYQVVLESNMLFSGECPKGAHIVPLLQFCFSFSTVTLATTTRKRYEHTLVCVLLTFSDGCGEKKLQFKTKTTKSGIMWAPLEKQLWLFW